MEPPPPVEGEVEPPDTANTSTPPSGEAEKTIHPCISDIQQFPPLSDVAPKNPSQNLVSSANAAALQVSSVSSPTHLPWAARMKSSLRNLHRAEPPQYLEDSTPVVRAPPSVLLKTSEKWAGYLEAYFFGKPPPPAKIYADLNPIWGRSGNISMHQSSPRTYLFLIPSVSTREWVTQIGYWQTGLVGFKVSPWTPSSSIQKQKLTTLPIWVKLSHIPSELYTINGISNIATAIGEPLHTEKSRLLPSRTREAKVKVEIQLDRPITDCIVVRDQDGDTVSITATYPRLPPLCEDCHEFGHFKARCPYENLAKANPPPRKAVIKQTTPTQSQALPATTVKTSSLHTAEQSLHPNQLNIEEQGNLDKNPSGNRHNDQTGKVTSRANINVHPLAHSIPTPIEPLITKSPEEQSQDAIHYNNNNHPRFQLKSQTTQKMQQIRPGHRQNPQKQIPSRKEN